MFVNQLEHELRARGNRVDNTLAAIGSVTAQDRVMSPL